MKVIFNKHWKKSNKFFSIVNYKDAWKIGGTKPMIKFKTNGARKKIDNCLDVYLIIGYTIFNYIDFDYCK